MVKTHDPERVAQIIAHRPCHGAEHDPLNGKIHGWCLVCGVQWPCAYAGAPPVPLGNSFASIDDAIAAIDEDRRERQPLGVWEGMKCAITALEQLKTRLTRDSITVSDVTS